MIPSLLLQALVALGLGIPFVRIQTQHRERFQCPLGIDLGHLGALRQHQGLMRGLIEQARQTTCAPGQNFQRGLVEKMVRLSACQA